MYKATVDGKTFDVESIDWDAVEYAPNCFHIIYNKKSYRAEIVKADGSTKTFSIKVNGVVQNVALKDKFDLLLEKMGMTSANASKINNIKAPMPGLIIDLKVKSGDTVNAGDVLLILEAMKMENVLKAPGSGTIKAIKIKKGDSVEKGQILIEF
ncbi:MAG TPA: biotin/lipoyl-containing protein [Cyclobacteriaceae bacterium]